MPPSKTSSTRNELPSYEVINHRELMVASIITKAVAKVTGCSHTLMVRPYGWRLKTSRTLVKGHEEVKLVLTRKCPPSLLASIPSTRECYADCWKGKVSHGLTQVWVLWTTRMTILTRPAYGCNSGTNIMGVTNCSQLGFRVRFTGETHGTVSLAKNYSWKPHRS